MSKLRSENHDEARAWLGRLEKATAMKNLGPAVFSGAGGQGSGATAGSFGSGFFHPYPAGARHDSAAEAGDLWRNSAVAACLSWIGDNFPEPDLRVIRTNPRTGDESPVLNHPLVKLLKNPNPYYGWQTLAKGLVLSYRTDGNAHWLIAGDSTGTPRELWYVPHFRLRPRWNPSGNEYLGWWDYQVNGRVVKLGTDQVVHFRDGIDPDQDRLGCAPLKHTLREVCSDNQGASFTASIMRNMGVVGYVITPANPRDSFGTKEERDEIADTFTERFAGEGRGRPLVAEDAMKLEKVGMTPEELTLDAIMKIPESRICAALRVPAMVVGLAVGAEQRTFSNYGEARKAAYEDGIIPMQKEIAHVINMQLLPLLGDPATERFEFDYSRVPCLSESEDARTRRFGEAFQTYNLITRNEGRKALAFAPVPGGNQFADGSTATAIATATATATATQEELTPTRTGEPGPPIDPGPVDDSVGE